MEKRKILVMTLVILSSLFLLGIFLLPNMRSDEEQFYQHKTELQGGVQNPEDLEAFKIAFRKAVSNAGYTIKDDFINIWCHLGGFQQYGMNYHLLTDDNSYIMFEIKSPSIESVSNLLISGTPIKKVGFNPDQIANDLVYYVDETSIKLDSNSY